MKPEADPASLPRRSLYRQFVRLLLVPLLVAFLLASAGTVSIGYHTEQAKQAAERERIVEVFSQALTKPLWDCDGATAQGILDSLAYLPAVAAAQLSDRCQGQQLASGASRRPDAEATTYRQPITYHDEQGRAFAVGELRVQFLPASIATAALDVLWRYLLLLAVLLGVMLAGTLLVFRRIISRPLDRFRAAIRSGIESSGGDTPRLSDQIRQHNDELGDVMQAYDELMTELARVIDQLRDNEQALMLAARRDPLTGLGNRLVLEEELGHTILRAERQRAQGCVLLIDLDGFKPINDTHGHAAGDCLLKEIAGRLQASVRRCDTVIRLGGDEFVVIVEGLHGESAVHTLIDKLDQAIQAPVAYREHNLRVSASIGAACFPDDGRSSKDLLAHADRMMYARKRRRRAEEA